MGTLPTDPTATFGITEVHRHQSLDVALFIIDEDATARVPSLTPIAASRQHPNAWLDQHLDAAGYGETHDGSIGRFFASVLVESISNTTVQVNGQGQQGICFGDSGGPLLAPGPVVVAVESWGEASCVGRDYMKRLDTLTSWIDPIVDSHGGAPAPDSCDGLDYLGRCNGDVAEWCEDGEVRQYDCSNDDMTCGYVDEQIGYYCIEPEDDPCEGLDYLGRCNGDVAEWCEDGELRKRDCASEGLVCGYVDEQVGYYCMGASGGDDGGGDDGGGDDGGGDDGGGDDGGGDDGVADQLAETSLVGEGVSGCQSASVSSSAAPSFLVLLALGLLLGRASCGARRVANAYPFTPQKSSST